MPDTLTEWRTQKEMADLMPQKIKWKTQKRNGGHRIKMADNGLAGIRRDGQNDGQRNKMVDTETKWRTQKQNGGPRNKIADTETKWRTQKQNGGHRNKMADTERKWLTPCPPAKWWTKKHNGEQRNKVADTETK
jgi:hypothetical protein